MGLTFTLLYTNIVYIFICYFFMAVRTQNYTLFYFFLYSFC